MTSRARLLILVFAVAGLAFAGSSAWVHYKLITQPAYVSPCDINATFSCTEVYRSQYGTIRGVPVAIGGVIWFALVGLLAAFARPGDRNDPSSAYVFSLATVGLGAIIYLAYASYFVLKMGCVLCIGTYVSVIGIFIVSSAAVSMPMTRLPGRLFNDLRSMVSRPTALLVAVLFLAFAASAIAFFPKEATSSGMSAGAASAPGASGGSGTTAPAKPAIGTQSPDIDKAFADAWFQQQRVDIGVPANGAKVLIVKFIDWQCPSCKAAHFAYKPILEEFEKTNPGAVRQVIKDYPLNSRCNYGVSREIHPSACEEAAAVRMVREKGKEAELVTWLFGMPDVPQMQRTPDMVEAQVKQLVGVQDFAREYAARLPDIKRDVADGGALRVSQTPTYFINGVRAQTEQGWLPPHFFALAIKLELDKASGKSPQP